MVHCGAGGTPPGRPADGPRPHGGGGGPLRCGRRPAGPTTAAPNPTVAAVLFVRAVAIVNGMAVYSILPAISVFVAVFLWVGLEGG